MNRDHKTEMELVKAELLLQALAKAGALEQQLDAANRREAKLREALKNVADYLTFNNIWEGIRISRIEVERALQPDAGKEQP